MCTDCKALGNKCWAIQNKTNIDANTSKKYNVDIIYLYSCSVLLLLILVKDARSCSSTPTRTSILRAATERHQLTAQSMTLKSTQITSDWNTDGVSDLQYAAFLSPSPWAKVSMETSLGLL